MSSDHPTRVGSDAPDMRGKVVLITGASGGIGRAIAAGIAKLGATTVLVGRDPERAESAAAQIVRMSANPEVEVMLADLSSQAAIRHLARDFVDRHARLDVLINNVGGLFAQRKETVDGLEATLAINHLCPFLLTHLLLPALASSQRARVVNVNSEGHRGAERVVFDDLQTTGWKRPFSVYSQSKLANLMFSYELARRLDGTEITVNALHPGMVDTDLVKRFLRERFFPGNKMLNGLVTALARRVAKMRYAFTDADQAACTALYLASSPAVEGVTGKYFNEDGHPVQSSPASYDAVAAQQLWRVSAALTGLGENAIDGLPMELRRRAGTQDSMGAGPITEGA